MMNLLRIKRFGESKESPPLKQWYQEEGEDTIACNETIVDKLWNEWVSNTEGVKRADNDNFAIFEFLQPFEISI